MSSTRKTKPSSKKEEGKKTKNPVLNQLKALAQEKDALAKIISQPDLVNAAHAEAIELLYKRNQPSEENSANGEPEKSKLDQNDQQQQHRLEQNLLNLRQYNIHERVLDQFNLQSEIAVTHQSLKQQEDAVGGKIVYDLGNYKEKLLILSAHVSGHTNQLQTPLAVSLSKKKAGQKMSYPLNIGSTYRGMSRNHNTAHKSYKTEEKVITILPPASTNSLEEKISLNANSYATLNTLLKCDELPPGAEELTRVELGVTAKTEADGSDEEIDDEYDLVIYPSKYVDSNRLSRFAFADFQEGHPFHDIFDHEQYGSRYVSLVRDLVGIDYSILEDNPYYHAMTVINNNTKTKTIRTLPLLVIHFLKNMPTVYGLNTHFLDTDDSLNMVISPVGMVEKEVSEELVVTGQEGEYLVANQRMVWDAVETAEVFVRVQIVYITMSQFYAMKMAFQEDVLTYPDQYPEQALVKVLSDTKCTNPVDERDSSYFVALYNSITSESSPRTELLTKAAEMLAKRDDQE